MNNYKKGDVENLFLNRYSSWIYNKKEYEGKTFLHISRKYYDEIL